MREGGGEAKLLSLQSNISTETARDLLYQLKISKDNVLLFL